MTSRRSSPSFCIGAPPAPQTPRSAFFGYQLEWLRRFQGALAQMSRAEEPPVTSEKIYLPMDATTEAVIEITIKSRGLGAIDPPTRRAPTAKELHQLSDLLTRRIYQFHPCGD